MRSNANIKEFTRQLLDKPTNDNRNTIVKKRLNVRRDTIELDKKLVKKLSKSDITQERSGRGGKGYSDTDTDTDDDNDDDNYDDNDNFGRTSSIPSSKIRNLLHRRTSKSILKAPSLKMGMALLKHSSFMELIQEKEPPKPIDTSNTPPVSSPIFSHKNKKSSAIFHTETKTFVKLSQEAIKFLIRLQAFNLLEKSECDDNNIEGEILEITVRFKDALNTFNREIIKIGMALPLDFMDNGDHHHSHHNNYPGTRIFYFVCQRGSRQVMHILADCLYKSSDEINIPLILSGLNLLLLPIEALKMKMKQMENNESLDWPKEMIKVFLNWSAETFQELASTGAIPLLTKIIQQTDKCLNPVIQLVAYTLLQQLVIVSDSCMSQLLYEPPLKEKQSHSTVINRLRDESQKKLKKISDEEILLKMKKTVESEFRQTLHEKDLRESLYRRPFKKTQTSTKSLKKETKNDFILLRNMHFSFIEYGCSSCISIILTSAIANQNRHEVVGNFASLIWVMASSAADEELIKNISMILSNKIKIDKLKEPYKSYKDTKQKLTLVQSKEAVAELGKPSSEMIQISVLDFLLSCTKRYRTAEKTLNIFATYTKICKALYSLMNVDFIFFTVMKSSKSIKQVIQSFTMFTTSRSMKNDIEHLRQKISMVRENQAKKDTEFDQPRVATSTFKFQDGLGNSNAIHRPRSAPSIRRRENVEESNQDSIQNKRTTPSIIRPKSAGAVESYNNMHIGQAPILPKKIQLQIPAMEYPIFILSPEEKRKKITEHEKAVEMALLLQDALTSKSKKTFDEDDEVPTIIEPISFDIENSITSSINGKINIASDSSTLQKFEQNVDYNFDVFQDEDFDKTINDVLIIRSMRNAINDSKDMIDFHNTISNMNINLTHEQINELYKAIKNNKNHKDCLKILNDRK